MKDVQFPNALAEFVFYRTYSRWRDDLGRRETWTEAIDRVFNFLSEKVDGKISAKEMSMLKEKVLTFQVMPSMRLVWTAGEAAKVNNMSIYNCSFATCRSIKFWAEELYILMHGTGMGFSVRSKYVDQLPPIAELKDAPPKVVVFGDSKLGWAKGLHECCIHWWNGYKVEWDLSKIRPEGAPLKTFGGRASGPSPLNKTLSFFRDMIERHRGRRLSPINCHDLACVTAECVLVGGVRRAALISLSDLYDHGMRGAKEGQFWIQNDHRKLSNNSAVYVSKPCSTDFMEEWLALAKSGTGERGVFNLSNIKNLVPARRDASKIEGVNPCSEILLRDFGLCNLSEVVIRPGMTIEQLEDNVRAATILGTIQASLTDFGDWLDPQWKKNAEEEALLGVSLTGQMDNPDLLTPQVLEELRDFAVGVNVKFSRKLGINRSKAITCTKPSGSVSQLLDSSSGVHPRFAPYYIRRVRISRTDPLFKVLQEQNIPVKPEVGFNEHNALIWVLEFPIKSPETSKTADVISAIEQCEWWKKLKTHWAEHTISCTVYVKEDEWLKVGNWVYENWQYISGISFLPYSEHKYQLAPYEAISKEKYEELVQSYKAIDYTLMTKYEKDDRTTGAHELACTGGKCELT